MRRQEANARERSRMHGLNLNARNFLTDHNGEVVFSGRPPYDPLYSSSAYPGSERPAGVSCGCGPSDPAKPFRHYGYSGAYEPSYASPEAGSPHFESQLSPPVNLNGIFAFKQDEPPDYGRGGHHYGVRYCSATGRAALAHGSMYRVAPEGRYPYDLHVRGQSFQAQGDLNASYHN
uniref:Neuronal differentiation 6b n=1 Tax=Hippocampus comes TaxID=109280 RepID=A0A3Q2YCJ9_HIPCM